jgi:hypothetical protein
MATRSTIALEFADGTVQQVYCHWDGYLAHNGEILAKHYSDPFKLRDLIDQGDVSSLGTVVGKTHSFSPFHVKNSELSDEENARIEAELKASYEAAREAGYTTFYGRDRGEKEIAAKRFKDYADYVENFMHEEYAYILRTDGVWYVKCHSADFVTLAEAFEAEKEAA